VNSSIAVPFKGDQLGLADNAKWKAISEEKEQILCSAHVDKHHHSNPSKTQQRMVIVTTKNFFVLDGSMVIKDQIPLQEVQALAFSPYGDGVFVVQSKVAKKGDTLFSEASHIFEIVTRTFLATKALGRPPRVVCSES
jgi:hypothetical protein